MEKSNKAVERKTTEITSLVITRVHEGKRKGLIFFDMIINGICINGMSVVPAEKGDFLSFPSYKGNDGKWYHHVWIDLSDADSAKILKLVQTKLDE